jgi:hypothetical protein
MNTIQKTGTQRLFHHPAWVQRRHNCSPEASFANCVMTLYLLKVHLQTFLSIPITHKCQTLSCDALVANERYVPHIASFRWRGASLGIVTTLQAVRPYNCISTTGIGKNFFSSLKLWDPHSLIPNVYRRHVTAVKRLRIEDDHSLSYSAEVKHKGSYTSNHPYAFTACCRLSYDTHIAYWVKECLHASAA